MVVAVDGTDASGNSAGQVSVCNRCRLAWFAVRNKRNRRICLVALHLAARVRRALFCPGWVECAQSFRLFGRLLCAGRRRVLSASPTCASITGLLVRSSVAGCRFAPRHDADWFPVGSGGLRPHRWPFFGTRALGWSVRNRCGCRLCFRAACRSAGTPSPNSWCLATSGSPRSHPRCPRAFA